MSPLILDPTLSKMVASYTRSYTFQETMTYLHFIIGRLKKHFGSKISRSISISKSLAYFDVKLKLNRLMSISTNITEIRLLKHSLIIKEQQAAVPIHNTYCCRYITHTAVGALSINIVNILPSFE